MKILAACACITISGLLAGSGCALDPAADAEGAAAATSTQYMDIVDYDGGAWYDVRQQLDEAFAGACASGLCPEAYPRIVSLGMFCSVTSKRGWVHDCVWTFAATQQAVDPDTAAIAVDAPSFQCEVRPAVGTTATELEDVLGGTDAPLDAKLPGHFSLRDTLADCFQRPIGATPVTPAADATARYVAPEQYYTSARYLLRWAATGAALSRGFDGMCGDTFCSGDYANLQSMALSCAITRSTGHVKECAWLLAGSYALPDRHGDEVVSAQSWRCQLPVHGSLSQLMDAITAPAARPEDVLRRPLPGTTATPYDALLDCL